MHLPVQYEPYRLSRVLSIHAIVSADHVIGEHLEHQVHAHESAWELCYCMADELSVRHNNANLLLKQGQCLLIPPGVRHNLNIMPEQAQGFVISFTCTDSYLSMLRGKITNTSLRQQRQFQEILTELRSAFQLEKNTLRVHHFQPSKTSLLGVPAALIEEKGVVSREVALSLAENIRTTFAADFGIGITGLAGPDGDGIHPVGTVFVALAAANDRFVREIHGGRDRDRIRTMAASHALDMLRRYMTGLPVEKI